MVCDFILKHKGFFADVHLSDKSIVSGCIDDCNNYFVLLKLSDSTELIFLKDVVRISFKENCNINSFDTETNSSLPDIPIDKHDFSTGITLKIDSIAVDFEERREELKDLPSDHLSRIKKLSELRRDLKNIERDNFKKKILSLDFVPTEITFGQPDLTKPIYKYPTKKTRRTT